MVQMIDLETAFWITIDVSIAFLTIYILTRYIKLKRQVREAKNRKISNLVDFADKFQKYVLNIGGREAVITIFNELIVNLAMSNHINISKNLTNKEVLTILSNNLPKDAIRILHEMYNLYELVRFGGHNPSIEEIEQFYERLELLSKTVNTHVGG